MDLFTFKVDLMHGINAIRGYARNREVVEKHIVDHLESRLQGGNNRNYYIGLFSAYVNCRLYFKSRSDKLDIEAGGMFTVISIVIADKIMKEDFKLREDFPDDFCLGDLIDSDIDEETVEKMALSVKDHQPEEILKEIRSTISGKGGDEYYRGLMNGYAHASTILTEIKHINMSLSCSFIACCLAYIIKHTDQIKEKTSIV